MLEYSTYSVISPEGCASILWKSADKAADAAEAMNMTSQRLNELGLIDIVISEPLGGAHRDVKAMANNLSTVLQENLMALEQLPVDELVEARYQRLMQFGQFEEA
jgi:acetyl-CoA carboxylase carboxyl transferase subunit alpha